MINVAAFTGGLTVPSARFRVRQYIPAFQAWNIVLSEYVSYFGIYPPINRYVRPFWALGTVVTRLPSIIQSYQAHLTLLQREMLSTFITLEKFTKNPRVLDVDDAIWLHPRGVFAQRLAALCDLVICGNTFLAEKFSQWNQNVAVVPTAVDTQRFKPLAKPRSSHEMVIGWSGSSSGFRYLYLIEEALLKVLRMNPQAVLRIISDKPPVFRQLPVEQVQFIPWTPSIEVSSLQDMTVGIMPLEDSDWERGKCSYKMLLYMACGLPVIVSPVGMNAEILSLGKCGLSAVTNRDWEMSLIELLSNDNMQQQMGILGRNIIETRFSIKIIAPVFASSLLKLAQ